MMQTILLETATLYDLEKQFGLQQVEDANSFQEWQTNLPELSVDEKQRLDRVKAIYSNLSRDRCWVRSKWRSFLPCWILQNFFASLR